VTHTCRPAAARLRAARAAVLGLSLGTSTGCYTSRAVTGVPDTGAQAVVTLNDRGRTALSDALGPNAERVEGSVVSRTDSAFVLAVRSVDYFGGATNAWRGEHVSVPVAGVRVLTERRLSRGRTYLVVGAAVAAVVAFIVTRSILADDGALVEDRGDGGNPQGSRVPVRVPIRP
jgi:hypothetical protein